MFFFICVGIWMFQMNPLALTEYRNLSVENDSNRKVSRHVAEKPQRGSIQEENSSNFPFISFRSSNTFCFVRHSCWVLSHKVGNSSVSVSCFYCIKRTIGIAGCASVLIPVNIQRIQRSPLPGSPSTFHALKTRTNICRNLRNDH